MASLRIACSVVRKRYPMGDGNGMKQRALIKNKHNSKMPPQKPFFCKNNKKCWRKRRKKTSSMPSNLRSNGLKEPYEPWHLSLLLFYYKLPSKWFTSNIKAFVIPRVNHNKNRELNTGAPQHEIFAWDIVKFAFPLARSWAGKGANVCDLHIGN